jgi:hypothetical protein
MARRLSMVGHIWRAELKKMEDERHLDAHLSLDDFDSLPGESPLRDIGRIPTYREAYTIHGKDW